MLFVSCYRIVRNKAAEKAKNCINNHNSNGNQSNSAVSPSHSNNATSVIVNASHHQSTPTSATYSINGILGIEEQQQRHQKRKNSGSNNNHLEGKKESLFLSKLNPLDHKTISVCGVVNFVKHSLFLLVKPL
jgi:hypothetical protein